MRRLPWLLLLAFLIGPLAIAAFSPGPRDGEISTDPVQDLQRRYYRIYSRVAPGVVTVEAGSQTASAVFWDGAGHLVTNAHVVDGRTKVVVRTYRGERHEAEVRALDSSTDLAVLRILADPPGAWPELNWGPSAEDAAVGTLVIAIGSSGGRAHSMRTGIVSASVQNSLGLLDHERFLTTDVAIQPGDSGGVLVDMYGLVVGLNAAAARMDEEGRRPSIGYTIPSSLLWRVVPDLIEHGYRRSAYLGIRGRDPVGAEQTEVPENWRAASVVEEVRENGPAHKAGLQVGDRVRGFDGRVFERYGDLRTALSLQRPGQVVALQILRQGERMSVSVELGEAPR